MDHLSFEIIFDVPAHASCSRQQLDVEALINGERIISPEALPVDVLELVASAIRPGSYFIWTCNCGVPQCSGIYRGVDVQMDATTVRWSSRDKNLAAVNGLVFDKEQYASAIDKLWKDYVQYYRAYKIAKIDFKLGYHQPEEAVLERINNG